jgi:hypothetical protein
MVLQKSSINKTLLSMQKPMFRIRIKENAWQAKQAAKKLKSESAAITIGKTIYLCNADAAKFMGDTPWLRHELKHAEQFRKYGFFVFIFLYLWESAFKGYQNNKYEIEARNAEKNNIAVENDYVFSYLKNSQ